MPNVWTIFETSGSAARAGLERARCCGPRGPPETLPPNRSAHRVWCLDRGQHVDEMPQSVWRETKAKVDAVRTKLIREGATSEYDAHGAEKEVFVKPD